MGLTQNYQTYLKLDLSQYVGQWIAIFKDKIIMHGANPKKVYEEAMKISDNKQVMLVRVPNSNMAEVL